MANVLYRFYSATGQLLYVGMTMNPVQRFRSHRGTKDWWGDVAGISIERYHTRDDLANAERRAIQVEHPLHNILRAKPVRHPESTRPAEYEPDPSTLSVFDKISSLFGDARRETCYGYVTDEEYERRADADRAKAAARQECALCDSDGYRGMVVCDHIDRSGGRWRAVRKDSLQVINGGGS